MLTEWDVNGCPWCLTSDRRLGSGVFETVAKNEKNWAATGSSFKGYVRDMYRDSLKPWLCSIASFCLHGAAEARDGSLAHRQSGLLR